MVVGGFHQRGGACRIMHLHEQMMQLTQKGQDKNGGVAAQDVMVRVVNERLCGVLSVTSGTSDVSGPVNASAAGKIFTNGKESNIRHSHKPCCETDCTVTTSRTPIILPKTY